jgi:hypothetical protein
MSNFFFHVVKEHPSFNFLTIIKNQNGELVLEKEEVEMTFYVFFKQLYVDT